MKKEQPSLKIYPVIIPCVLYHGKQKWIYGNNIIRSFESIKGTQKYVPSYQTEIIELSKVPVDFKSQEIELNAMLFALKYGRSEQVNEKLSQLLDSFENCTDTQFDYLLVVLKYLLVILPKKMRKRFLAIITTHKLGKKRNMKSIADSLIEEGVKKGKRIGFEKGESIGIKKGERLGVRKGEQIGIKKGEIIGVKKGERIGLEKGKHIGIKKGSSETELKYIKRMIQEGLDNKTIRKISHLTQKQLDEIKNETK